VLCGSAQFSAVLQRASGTAASGAPTTRTTASPDSPASPAPMVCHLLQCTSRLLCCAAVCACPLLARYVGFAEMR
jgi:hypothetical protein